MTHKRFSPLSLVRENVWDTEQQLPQLHISARDSAETTVLHLEVMHQQRRQALEYQGTCLQNFHRLTKPGSTMTQVSGCAAYQHVTHVSSSRLLFVRGQAMHAAKAACMLASNTPSRSGTKLLNPSIISILSYTDELYGHSAPRKLWRSH